MRDLKDRGCLQTMWWNRRTKSLTSVEWGLEDHRLCNRYNVKEIMIKKKNESLEMIRKTSVTSAFATFQLPPTDGVHLLSLLLILLILNTHPHTSSLLYWSYLLCRRSEKRRVIQCQHKENLALPTSLQDHYCASEQSESQLCRCVAVVWDHNLRWSEYIPYGEFWGSFIFQNSFIILRYVIRM